MEIFLIEENDVVYRVRKEEQGCTIFSSKTYIEGNDALYEILKEISDNGVENGILNLIEKYKCSDVILNDLMKLAESLQSSNVLKETAEKMLTYCKSLNRSSV